MLLPPFKVYDVHVLRFGGEGYGNIHGLLLSLWIQFSEMPGKFRNYTPQMPSQGINFILGKISFYGDRRYYIGAQNLCTWTGG